MESPFNRSYYNLSQPRRHYRGPPAAVRPSRVVSIPVHFVGSEAPSAIQLPRTEAASSSHLTRTAAASATHHLASSEAARKFAAALRIQKAARGFLVRKAVRVVRKLEAEVSQVERRLEEARDLVRREERERIRLNEALMGVLFRLDSVRGVRDYRKKVVRRAILLQEVLDCAANFSRDNHVPAEVERQTESKEITMETLEVATETPEPTVTDNSGRENIVFGPSSDAEKQRERDQISEDPGATEKGDLASEVSGTEIAVVEEQEQIVESEEKIESLVAGVESMAAEQGEILEPEEKIQSLAPSTAEEQEAEQPEEEAKRETPSSKIGGNSLPLTSARSEDDEFARAEEKGMNEVMERMVLESERLRGLVAELMETNAAQCRMLYGLSQRVETLEKKVAQQGRKNKRARKCCDMKN